MPIYKIDNTIPPPLAGDRHHWLRSPERRTLQLLQPGQSFVITDQNKRKPMIDMIYQERIKFGRLYLMRPLDDRKGWRIWRLPDDPAGSAPTDTGKTKANSKARKQRSTSR
jgi:hypothetical protein